jgi:hypothetical protein
MADGARVSSEAGGGGEERGGASRIAGEPGRRAGTATCYPRVTPT